MLRKIVYQAVKWLPPTAILFSCAAAYQDKPEYAIYMMLCAIFAEMRYGKYVD